MTDLRTLVRERQSHRNLITIVAIDDEMVRRRGQLSAQPGHARPDCRCNNALRSQSHCDRPAAGRFGAKDVDEALALSLRGSPSVIAAAAVYPGGRQTVAEGDGPLARVPNAERFLWPLKAFSDVTAVGVVNVVTDWTGTPRFVPLLFRAEDRTEALFLLRAAMAGRDQEWRDISLGGQRIRRTLVTSAPAFYGFAARSAPSAPRRCWEAN